jgi:hypothetical protein
MATLSGVRADAIAVTGTGKECDHSWAFSFQITVEPGNALPPYCLNSCDEAYYVLDGTLEVRVGDRTRTATRGEFLRIPSGAVRAYRNRSSLRARLLVCPMSPSVERFLEGPPLELDQVIGLAAYHYTSLTNLASCHQRPLLPASELPTDHGADIAASPQRRHWRGRPSLITARVRAQV